MKDVNPSTKRKPLTLGEVQEAFEPLGVKYPAVLSLALAAELSGYTPLTLKKKLSEGCSRDCVSRGKGRKGRRKDSLFNKLIAAKALHEASVQLLADVLLDQHELRQRLTEFVLEQRRRAAVDAPGVAELESERDELKHRRSNPRSVPSRARHSRTRRRNLSGWVHGGTRSRLGWRKSRRFSNGTPGRWRRSSMTPSRFWLMEPTTAYPCGRTPA